MLRQIFRSKKLRINVFLVLLTQFVKVEAKTISNISSDLPDVQNTEVIEKQNFTQSDFRNKSLQGDASERVEKILNVPITLNFDDQPVTKPGRGFYGGHRRNYETTPEEEKVDNGGFGSRIILGIVENIVETTTKPADQRKSQTIVKFFDKEDYNGIKTNPIVVEDVFEVNDDNQQEKVRNRKEILQLKQEPSPINSDNSHNQKNSEQEDDTDLREEKEDIENDEELDGSPLANYNTEHDEESSDIRNEGIDHENKQPQREKHREIEEPSRHIYEENNEDNLKYEDYEIPNNHKGAYTEIEDAGINPKDKQFPKEKQTKIKEPPRHIYEENNEENRKYEEYEIPNNHKETYTEIEEPDNRQNEYKTPEDDSPRKYEKLEDSHNEERSPKYTLHEDSVVEQRPEKYKNHDKQHKESAKASELNEDVTHNDHKKSADDTHGEVKKKKKGGKFSSGKGEEHHSEHHGHKGEKGVKKYEGFHEETKSQKGHHDKEGLGKKYDDKGGSEKKHHEEHGHHGQHHKGEKGEKASDFSEEGKHSKGHSTKGEHNIHKKDEYEKNQEFYDEHHEGGEHEKHGGFHFDDHFEKGGHKKGGHHKKGEHEDHYGKKSLHEKGNHYDENKGQKKAGGHGEHHSHHSKHGKKGSHSGKKQWAFKKGSGGGGKKRYKSGPQVAHSTPQHIRRVPPSIHSNYKEEGKKYPHYVGKVYVENGNRRGDFNDGTDKISDERGVINNTETDEGKNNVKQKLMHELKKFEEETRQNESIEEIPLNSDEVEKQETRVQQELHADPNEASDENEHRETNSEYTQANTSSSGKKDGESSTNSSKHLPKIYVILPEDFEKQLKFSEENFDDEIASLENESSYEDSEEKFDESIPRKSKIRSTHNQTTTIVEPLRAESFPEEHRRRLSEIEYVVHRIGLKNRRNEDANRSDTDSEEKLDMKPRKFSINSSEGV